MDADGVGVNDLGVVDQLGVLRERGGAVRHVGGAGQGEGHVLRGERLAVVEGDALAEREFPGGVADDAPRGGETGADAAAGVGQDQGIEDVAHHGGVGNVDVIVRIDRTGVGADGDLEVGGARARGHGDGGKQRGGR